MGSQNCGGFEEGKLSNQAYGDFWVLEHKGSRKAKIVKLIEKQGVVKQTIEESLIKRCQIKHANICQLHSFLIHEEGNLYEISFEYQYLQMTLNEKMEKIRQQHSIIPFEDLSILMNDVASALKHLYSHSVKHGCINGNTILGSSQGYKITDVSSTSYLTLMELTQKGSRDEPISKKNTRFVNDIILKNTIVRELTLDDDLFSLGMTVLSLATHTPVSEFYAFKEIQRKLHVQMKEQAINDALYLLRKRYNKDLEERVKKLMFPSKLLKDTSIIEKQARTNENSHYSFAYV